MNDCIYLNNAATTYPKPASVLDGISKLLKAPPIHHLRAGFRTDAVDTDVVDICRIELASLFNVPEPNRIVFSSGATESLNLALRGLPLDGKHVVTTVIEHNSVLRPLKTMERDGRITLSIVKCDEYGSVSPDSIAEAILPNTAAVVVNHCSNVTGIVNDIEAIGSITKKNKISFIVDASQSAGLYPIDVQKANIDILVFTGHKSLYGIQGIGGAYISNDIILKPLKVGGTGIRSDYLFQPETVPMYYEAGTQNIPGILALYEGVRYINKIGMDNIRERKENIVQVMKSVLSHNKNVTLFPGISCKFKPTLFSFTVKGMEPEDIGYILENNFNIIVRTGLHCAPLIHKYLGTFPSGSVRVSPSHFTSEKEIEKFNEAVHQILQMIDK